MNVPPISTASRQSAGCSAVAIGVVFCEVVAGRREDVQDPAFVVFVIADEDAVAVPDSFVGEVAVAWA